MAPPRRHVISTRRQLAVLVSPVRQEIADVLSRMGRASVREIAAALGRPADGLYYHLRALARGGLVAAAGTRSRGGRDEALYRTAAPVLMIRHVPDNAGDVSTVVGSMLRLGIRDFRRAAASGRARTQGDRRELWALRATGWLSPDDVAGVNRRIQGLHDALVRTRGRGRLFAVTILLTPLDHRARAPRRRAPAPRRART